MSIEFLPVSETQVEEIYYVSTHSGGPIYGGYRQTPPQAYCNSIGESYFGALAQQSALAAQLAYQSVFAAGQNPFLPEPSQPIEDAGISAGEIIAHRAWGITASGLLQSTTMDKKWPIDGVMEGNPSAGVGVHAFKSQSDALTYGDNCGRVAIGTILLWGEVVEHELGYRAQFGKVNSIDLIIGFGWGWRWRERRILKRLRRRYGV